MPGISQGALYLDWRSESVTLHLTRLEQLDKFKVGLMLMDSKGMYGKTLISRIGLVEILLVNTVIN